MFFTQIHQMMTEGVDLTLVMRKAQGQLTVSIMPKSNSLKDGAQNHLVPLTLSGTPPELDAGFFAATMQPMQRVAGLISNMAEFEKQAQTAAASSKAAKEKEQKTSKDTKEPKEVKEKREKYEKYLKKAEEQSKYPIQCILEKDNQVFTFVYRPEDIKPDVWDVWKIRSTIV